MKTMKHFYLILIVMLALAGSHVLVNATPVPVAPDTLNHYVIDNQPIEQFDGSQLVGKIVVGYRITTVVSASNVIRIHDIRTEGADTRSVRVVSTQPADPAYVVDGKQVSKDEFERLNPSRIHSVMVIKNGSREDVKQYVGWENGVILVTTKKDGGSSVETGHTDSLKVLTFRRSSVTK